MKDRATRLALARDGAYIIVGALIQAISVVMFYNPADLAPGGVSGVALLLNRVAGLPIGALVLWLLGQLAVLWPALRAASIPPATATRSV